jgi:hypothetical protein
MLSTKTTVWDAAMDEKLEKAYRRGKEAFWNGVAKELGEGVSWKAAEDRAWDLGKKWFVKKL